MELEDYQEIISRTAVYPTKVDNFGGAYAALGLMDELLEFQEKVYNNATREEIRKEYFDAVWYAAALSKEFNLELKRIILISRDTTMRFSEDTIKFFGMVKKFYRDNKPVDKTLMEESIAALLSNGAVMFDDEEYNLGLQENYDKLIDRHNRNVVRGDGDNR